MMFINPFSQLAYPRFFIEPGIFFCCVIKGWVFYRALRRKRRAAAMASGVGQIASKMNAMR